MFELKAIAEHPPRVRLRPDSSGLVERINTQKRPRNYLAAAKATGEAVSGLGSGFGDET